MAARPTYELLVEDFAQNVTKEVTGIFDWLVSGDMLTLRVKNRDDEETRVYYNSANFRSLTLQPAE